MLTLFGKYSLKAKGPRIIIIIIKIILGIVGLAIKIGVTRE